MTVHATVALTITSPDKLAAYREKAGPALVKHGGSVLQASKELEVLEGTANLPSMLAILAFPDKPAALGWINDPELQDIHALRRGCGQSTIILL